MRNAKNQFNNNNSNNITPSFSFCIRAFAVCVNKISKTIFAVHKNVYHRSLMNSFTHTRTHQTISNVRYAVANTIINLLMQSNFQWLRRLRGVRV